MIKYLLSLFSFKNKKYRKLKTIKGSYGIDYLDLTDENTLKEIMKDSEKFSKIKLS